MEIGKLNSRIVIEQRAQGQDSTGRPNGAWVALATVYASIAEQVPRDPETQHAGHDSSVVRSRIVIRRRTDVTSNMRVVYRGDVFLIRAVVNDYANRQQTELHCERVHG